MANKFWFKLGFFITFISFFSSIFIFLPARAAVSTWQKGVSIRSRWDGDFGSGPFKQTVDNAATTGINYISLVFPYYQSNLYSTDIQRGGDTSTDSALISAISYIHTKGLKVMLKPHLESYTGEWRAYINPADRSGWFLSYGNMVKHYATIAAQNNVEDLVIGSELISMAQDSGSNTQNWKNLIAQIRQIYSGKLTYSANWGPSGFVDEKNHIAFWSDLDYIGIAAYFNLNANNDVASLKNAWDGYNKNDIGPLAQKWNKPVVFTEIGYKSVPNSFTQPWNYNFGGSPDQTTQANAYQALFEYWNNYSFMQGVQLWEWQSDPNAGGAGDGTYTPQRKQAQSIMSAWFGSAVQPPSSGTPKFAVSSANNPTTAAAGQAVDIASTVTNSGQNASGINVDVEVYGSAGQKVFQKVYDNQSFGAGQAQTYHTSFSLPANSTYTVKIGVFSYSWSTLYVWVDNAGQINGTGGGTSPPPPTAGQIDIWWPTNGAGISGNTPFKGLVTNLSLDQYNMYWQVEGGGLVAMPNNQTDYPHKEFVVDTRSWTWKGNGPYHVNFVAKRPDGTVIGQKTLDVNVFN